MIRLILICLLLLTPLGCFKKDPADNPNNPPVKVIRNDWSLFMKTVKTRAKDLNGYTNWIAPTGSMRPLIQDYDWVIMLRPEQAPFEDLEIGDIVAYEKDGGILHRITYKDNWGFVLGGDHNSSNDVDVRLTKENYLGKLVEIYRYEHD